MRDLMPLSILLIGCAPGPAEPSLVRDLRVIAATVEPPEIGPDEVAAAAITVAAPLGEGVETLAWTCLDLGDGCLEAAAADWLVIGDQPTLDLELTAPPAAIVEQAPFLPVTLWTLACAPGVCPVIAEAEAAVVSGTLPPGLATGLADPASWLADLPMAGVSLARRTVIVSARPVEARNTNPTLVVTPPDGLSVGGSAELSIAATDADGDMLTAWVYATDGGFERAELPVDAPADVVLYAPEATGTVDLWVVVEDGRGGSALWSGTVEVR